MERLRLQRKSDDLLDITVERSRKELIELTKAACTLMSADSTLRPCDAVGDVLQVYLNVAKMFGKEGKN